MALTVLYAPCLVPIPFQLERFQSAFECRGNNINSLKRFYLKANLHGVKVFYLKAKAIMWPCLSYIFHIYSTAVHPVSKFGLKHPLLLGKTLLPSKTLVPSKPLLQSKLTEWGGRGRLAGSTPIGELADGNFKLNEISAEKRSVVYIQVSPFALSLAYSRSCTPFASASSIQRPTPAERVSTR